MDNPVLRGWINDDGCFDHSTLSPTWQQLERILIRWARRPSKRLRGHQRRAAHGLRRMACHQPELCEHWRLWYAAVDHEEPDEPRGARPVP